MGYVVSHAKRVVYVSARLNDEAIINTRAVANRLGYGICFVM